MVCILSKNICYILANRIYDFKMGVLEIMVSNNYWLIREPKHRSDKWPTNGLDEMYYYLEPDTSIKEGDIAYFWDNPSMSLYGWGKVVENPIINNGLDPDRSKNWLFVKFHRHVFEHTAWIAEQEIKRIRQPLLGFLSIQADKRAISLDVAVAHDIDLLITDLTQ